MKKLLLGLLLATLLVSASLAEYVSGHYRSDGIYVNGYYRSDSNYTVRDNYSYEGNLNPYTGEYGHNHYRHNQTSEYYLTY